MNLKKAIYLVLKHLSLVINVVITNMMMGTVCYDAEAPFKVKLFMLLWWAVTTSHFMMYMFVDDDEDDDNDGKGRKAIAHKIIEKIRNRAWPSVQT